MKIHIEPYNPNWKIEFEEIREVYLRQLERLQVAIEHVGSTSVPGLSAKPILDIDIIVKGKQFLPEITARLENLGYISEGELGIRGRFSFKQKNAFTPFVDSPKQWQSHHLYVCLADSLALRNHLLFRDTLKKSEDLIEKYTELKLALTDKREITREEYTKRKTDFIISVLAKAGLDESQLKEITNANS